MTAVSLEHQVLAASLDGVIALDTDLRCLLWNNAMEDLSGIRAETALGKPMPEVFPSLAPDGDGHIIQRALAGEDVSTIDQPLLLSSGGQRNICQARYTTWRDAGGATLGVIAIVRNVTKVKEAELLAHETELRFRTMADVAPVLLWMADTTGLCTFFNTTWLKFTGRTLDDEWGVGWAEGVHFEDFQSCMDIYAEAFSARRVFEMEYRLRRHDGEYRWILDRGTPRTTPDGRFAGYIGSCIDITERKNLEFDLTASIKIRDEFLSIASHELRTPLAAMQLQVEGLERIVQKRGVEQLAPGRLARDLERTTSHVRRMTALVDSLLDISRLTEGRLVLDLKETDLCTLAEDVVRTMRPTAAATNTELRLTTTGSLTGTWDRLRLEQVLTNLLANAIKFGAGKPIDVTVDGDETTARLTVRDQGIGIPREQQKRIFERFERGVSSRHFGGFGLGLWITKQIITGHRGAIAVDSRPGAGAAFTVTLPRGRA